MSFVQQLIGWVSGAITSALNEFWNWVTGTLATIFDKVKEVLSGMAKWVWENATNAFNTIIVQPLTSGLRAAAAYVMQKLKGTLYIAIVVPLMLKEVRGIIEWRSPQDIGLGIAKLLLKPIIARIGVELFWALLPSVLPAPSILQPPTVQPVPPAPPAFTAPPPAAKTVQAAWTDTLEATAGAAIVAGAVKEIADTVAASAVGQVVPPATASLSDSVAASATGAAIAPATVSLSDAVTASGAGAANPPLSTTLSDSVAASGFGFVSPYPLRLSDSVSASSTGAAIAPASISWIDSVSTSSAGSAGPLYVTISQSDSVASSAALGNSSGIDPFRPLWLYQYTNTGIKRLYWDFYSSGEVTSFFTSTSKPSWYDNYAYFDTVTAYREDARYAYAVVACFKPTIVTISQETSLIYIGIDDGSTALRGAYVTAVDAQTLRLYDRGGLSYQQFSWGGDWLVLYVSFPEKVARVYDRNGNLLASMALQDYMTGGTSKYTVTGNSPSSSIKLMIDWVTASTP